MFQRKQMQARHVYFFLFTSCALLILHTPFLEVPRNTYLNMYVEYVIVLLDISWRNPTTAIWLGPRT